MTLDGIIIGKGRSIAFKYKVKLESGIFHIKRIKLKRL